jgi:hypothetical protein
MNLGVYRFLQEWFRSFNFCLLSFLGLSYTGSTPALGAGRLGSIPSSPTNNSRLQLTPVEAKSSPQSVVKIGGYICKYWLVLSEVEGQPDQLGYEFFPEFGPG